MCAIEMCANGTLPFFMFENENSQIQVVGNVTAEREEGNARVGRKEDERYG